jgi:hypothetical protein
LISTFRHPMIHPFFTKLVTQPGLFAEHVGAYAGLASAEVRQFGSLWQRRVMLATACAIATVLAIGLSSVAAIVAAAVAWEAMPAPWTLVWIPALLWLLALGCGVAAWRTRTGPMFALVRQQMAVDLEMLHVAGQE